MAVKHVSIWPSIERADDIQLVASLVKDPSIWRHICDDYTADPDEWETPAGHLVYYLIARDGAGPCGFGAFVPRTNTTYEAHVGFLPRSYGVVALPTFKQMLAWIWSNTTARRLVGEIPIDNRRAIAFSKRAGFAEYGVNEKSRLRAGELIDQVCLGISKPG